MEALEKIYLFENPIDGTPDDRWLSKRSCGDDIEYIRKDAFIKRIHELLSCRIDYITYYHDKTEFVNEIIEDLNEDIE